jgi:hypothetical protein
MYEVECGGGGNPHFGEEIAMKGSPLSAQVLVARLSRMDGAWAGDVVRPDGSFVGRQQLSCSWDAQQEVLRVKSCLLSRVGRVLGAEELQIAYDPAAAAALAHFRHGAGRADFIAAAPGDGDDVVLVYDADLRLRRITWPPALDAAPGMDAVSPCRVDAVPGAPGDGALTVRLRRVAWLPRGQAGESVSAGSAL